MLSWLCTLGFILKVYILALLCVFIFSARRPPHQNADRIHLYGASLQTSGYLTDAMFSFAADADSSKTDRCVQACSSKDRCIDIRGGYSQNNAISELEEACSVIGGSDEGLAWRK